MHWYVLFNTEPPIYAKRLRLHDAKCLNNLCSFYHSGRRSWLTQLIHSNLPFLCGISCISAIWFHTNTGWQWDLLTEFNSFRSSHTNMPQCLKSPALPLFNQPFSQAAIIEIIKAAPRYWPLCGQFTGDRWFPRTMASNAENASNRWRHHDLHWEKTSFCQGCMWSPLSWNMLLHVCWLLCFARKDIYQFILVVVAGSFGTDYWLCSLHDKSSYHLGFVLM